MVKKDLVGITTSLMVFYAGELERAIMSSFKKATEYDSFKIPKGYAIACLL